MKKCECGELLPNSADVCKNCGIVYNDHRIVNLPEKIYNLKKQSSIETYNHTSVDLEATTTIPGKSKNKRLQEVLNRINLYIDNDSKYCSGLIKINKVCSQLRLSQKIETEARTIYKKLFKMEFFKKHKRKTATIMACIKYACNAHSYPVIFKELAQFCTEPKERIKTAFMLIGKYLPNIPKKRITVMDIIIKYGNNYFNLKNKDFAKIIKICKKLSGLKTSGKTPFGYAAGIIYVYMKNNDIKITRDKIANVMDISTPTITHRKGEIKKCLSLE